MYNQLVDQLSAAIGARLLVQFDYNGMSLRVEPHLIGVNQNKQDCLHAWQISFKPRKAVEGWHCFCLSEITNLVVLDVMFTAKRPGYDPYNTLMSRVYYRI